MNKFNENSIKLIEKLIQFLPKDINKFGQNLMSDQVIDQPIVHLRQELQNYVNEEVIGFFKSNDSLPERDDRSEDMSTKCEIILDKMWEIINCCDWSRVRMDFRHCFGFVSLLKALIQIRSIFTTTDPEFGFKRKLSALKTLDLGLLMSPRLTDDNILAKMATIIHKSITDWQTISGQNLESNDRTFEKSGNYSLNKRKTSETDLRTDSDLRSKVTKFDEKSNESQLNSCQRVSTKRELNQHFLSFIPYFKNNVKNQIKRVKDLDLFDFRDQYLVPKTPVIITDCMSEWPAMSHRKWSVDYIERVAAYRTVPIEIGSKYTDEEWTQKLMTIKEFVNQFILCEGQHSRGRQTGYLAQHNLFDQIEELMADISVPDYCSVSRDNDLESVDIDINGWFGPEATVSPLHYDPKDNLLAQVFGEKYIRLYSDETPSEAIYPNECRLLFNTSRVDLENVDSVKFENFKKLDNYYECLLKEGEMLFIPKNYWHFVKSLSASFSISFWWK